MARILTRPMFRKGGLSQTPRPSYRGGGVTAIRPRYRRGGMSGIMSGITPRRGYADGPNDPGFFKSIWNAINPTSGEIIQRMEKRRTAPSLVSQLMTPAPVEFRTQAEADAYLAANPGYQGEIKILDTGQTINTKLPSGSEVTTNGTKTNGTGNGVVDTRSQFEKYFREYLPVIQEQLGPDSDAASRDKWLALAKFGTGVMAQPGGDLAGAVGRAAEKPLEDLSRISAQERQAKQTPKMLALQAALNRMKGPTSQDRAIDASRIDNIAKDIAGRSNLTYETAIIVAEKLDDLRKSDSELAGKFSKEYPKDAKEVKKIVGPKYFYTDQGELKVVKDGLTYTLEEWKKESKKKK